MATGAPGTNGVWLYGEDDSNPTFSALLNRAGTTVNTQFGLDRARLTALEAAGTILASNTARKSDTFTTASTTYTTVTGLSVSITPKSVNSKILVLATVNFVAVSPTTTSGGGVSLFRGTTNLITPTSPGTRTAGISKLNVQGISAGGQWIHPTTINFVDTPNSTAAQTYSIQAMSFGAGTTTYVNRMFDDSDTANSQRLVSTITVIEIKG